MAAFWFSGAKLQKFRLNPNVARSLRVKLDMSVFVKTSNGIDSSEHTLEKFLGAQLVFDTRWKSDFWKPNNSHLFPKPKFSFAHIVNYTGEFLSGLRPVQRISSAKSCSRSLAPTRRLNEAQRTDVSALLMCGWATSCRIGVSYSDIPIKETNMAQKIIDIVGASKESFAKAAENAVAEAAKTVRGMRWARVADFEMLLDGKKISEYRVTTRIYFDIER
jgi:dodecin